MIYGNITNNQFLSQKNSQIDHQSLCSEMAEELRFAMRCRGSRQKPALRRSCSRCSPENTWVLTMKILSQLVEVDIIWIAKEHQKWKKISISYVSRYVPAAVEISRTASRTSGNSNLVSNDHRNHATKNPPDSINPVLSFGVAPNDGNPPANANLAFHDLGEPGLGPGINGKPTQRSHPSHHHHSSYMPGYESTSAH
jgi:hypothetical protein